MQTTPHRTRSRPRWRARPDTATHRATAVLLAMVVALGVSACATGDGKTLRAPTAPTPTSEDPDDPSADFDDFEDLDDSFFDDFDDGFNEPADVDDLVDQLPGAPSLALFAPWRDGAEIDSRYRCDGLDVSPALAWSGIPDGAAELAISMVDQDAEGMVHWLVTGIDPSFVSSPEGGLPIGGTPRRNSFDHIGWTGPCPPEDATHSYAFTVHALNQQLEGADDLSANETLALIDQLTFESASATGLASG